MYSISFIKTASYSDAKKNPHFTVIKIIIIIILIIIINYLYST